MPLQRSGSKQAFRNNVAAEMRAGRPQNQALAIAYDIKRRNRRHGGRLNRADGGDTFLPEDEAPFEAPLFMQSGMEEVPSPAEAIPTRTYRGRQVSDWSQRDPDAAYEASQERWRSMRDNPGDTARGIASVVAPVTGGIVSSAMENASDRAQQRGLAPLGGARRLAPSEPSAPLMAGVGNIFDLIGPSSAQAADDQPPTAPVINATDEEKAEIARVNGLIAGKRAELERATRQNVNQKTGQPLPPSPRMVAINTAINALQGDLDRAQGADSPLGLRRAAALDLHKEDVRRWNEARAKLASRATESQLPYAVKYPERQAWLQENMPAASAITGAVIGGLGRGKVLKPLASSMAAGAGEGAFTAAWPTLQDTEFLPPGQTWTEAADRIRNVDSDFLTRVGAAAGTHAGIAGGFSAGASKARQLIGQVGEGAAKLRAWAKTPPAETPPPATGGAAASVTESLPAPKVKAPPQIYHMPDGTVLKKYANGSWMRGNRFISKADAEALRGAPVAPSSTLHAPPTQARGGGVKSPMDVAYAVRRQKRADGGAVHAGPILSSVPGRTDHHPMDVASGSYVLPADHVSSLGEGNTSAGMEVVRHMLGGFGAEGGESQPGEPVPINAAGGEFVIAPEVVMAIGGGDIARGHKMLDEWVLMNRKKHISTLRKLPGPAKS